MRDKNFSLRWAAAVALLGLGFVDLARGGITGSALALTAAWLVAIPLAITGGKVAPPADPPPYRFAAGTGGLVLALYLLTLAPGTALWDASEYIAAAWTFGLPHPPGNPLFVVLGRAAALVPLPVGVAVRINLLAALCSAASAALWCLVAHRTARRSGATELTARLTGAAAALVGATAFTVWHQSVVNEKVYTVSLVGLALVSWLVLRWHDAPGAPGANRLLVLSAYLMGLGYANHMAGMLPLLAVGVLVLWRRPRLVIDPRLAIAAVAAVLLGLTPFATQPIRSAHAPPLNEGEPTACRDGLAWDCTFSRGTWAAFRDNFNRVQYAKPALTERQAPFPAQVGMWWLYFRWQWWRDVHGEHPVGQLALACLMAGLAILGARLQWQRARGDAWYFATLVAALTIVLVYYLNFKYGASQRPDLAEVAREVRDRDYFFLWGFSALGVWIALGLLWLWQQVPPRGARLAAPVLAMVAGLPLALNARPASRARDNVAGAFARDLLRSVEPYGVVVTAGDNDTFPLWYAQEVEGVRRDVTVVVTSLMNTDWFARGIIRRRQEPFVPDERSVFGDREWPAPANPALRLTMAQADSVPQLMPVREALQFRAGGVDAVIDPARLPQLQGLGPYLERADLLTLRIIADRGMRPVYISRTTGSYPELLGLENQTLAQGLARKVVPSPPQSSADTVRVAGSGWLDVRRSLALWRAFEGPAAVIERGDWVDPPSLSTVFGYLIAGSELAQALRAGGDASAAAAVEDTVRRMARAVRVEHLLRTATGPP